MATKNRTIRTWTIAGNASLDVLPCVVTLEAIGSEYASRVVSQDGTDGDDVDAVTDLDAIYMMQYVVEVAETDQADRINDAARDKAQEILDGLMDGGSALAALAALMGVKGR
jgi:hypothetical protein